MKIICATNMPYAREAFSRLGSVNILPPDQITPAAVRDAELLAVRSTTLVDRALLDGSRVRFAGTATIGIDHMDTAYLDQAGIRWCSAVGCNANSVAEYVVAAMLQVGERHALQLSGRTLAVIGVGNVGSRVVRKAAALGLRVLQNDPPLHDATGDPLFLPLDEVLAAADIVTLHTPLTDSGPYPTRQMVDAGFFARLKPGAVFINAARGGVQNSNALLEAMDCGRVAHAVLDTWEGEPVFRSDVMRRAAIATPHIGGHSFEGKAMGTLILYREACRFLGVEPDWDYEALLPPPEVPEVVLDQPAADQALLHRTVKRVYDIAADDARMRALVDRGDAERAAGFEQLRQQYPVRREFRFTRVHGAGLTAGLRAQLAGLEFRLDGP